MMQSSKPIEFTLVKTHAVDFSIKGGLVNRGRVQIQPRRSEKAIFGELT